MSYYNRQGEPITLAQMIAIETDAVARGVNERRVAETTLPDGTWISTVHLYQDHNFSGIGPPLIFETMVFRNRKDMGDIDCDRYATETEALAGHRAMVEKWTK